MQRNSESQSVHLMSVPLPDYGQLQKRYQALKLAERAQTVLIDAKPALKTAEEILRTLAATHNMKQLFVKIRKNTVLSDKMRPSDAKNLLSDPGNDFIEGTLHKLAAWQKTMSRVAAGEDIFCKNDKEFISFNSPLSLAIAGTSGLSNYLSIIQVALMELIKTDNKNAERYRTTIAEVRRCGTILSDCENASGISACIS